MKKLFAVILIFVLSVCCLTACQPPHRYAEEWSYDSQYHWHEVICIHDVQPEKSAHNMTDGECTVCGYGKKVSDKPGEEPAPPVHHVTSIGPLSMRSENGNSKITVYDGDGSGKYYLNGADSLRRKEYCAVPLKNLDLSYLKSQGSNVKITMTFTMWEEDDGYQEIFFYNKGITASGIKDAKESSLVSNGSLLAYKTDIEHGPGKKLTSKKNYVAECIVAASKITGDEIWILFDANGNNDDTWYIENIYVSVGQTSLSTRSMTVLEK